MDNLIRQYEYELEELIVMDDYDGGKAQQLRETIKDLKVLAISGRMDSTIKKAK